MKNTSNLILCTCFSYCLSTNCLRRRRKKLETFFLTHTQKKSFHFHFQYYHPLKKQIILSFLPSQHNVLFNNLSETIHLLCACQFPCDFNHHVHIFMFCYITPSWPYLLHPPTPTQDFHLSLSNPTCYYFLYKHTHSDVRQNRTEIRT